MWCYLRNRGISTWAIAVTLFNRFYARKSMKKNNTFVSRPGWLGAGCRAC